MTYFWTERFDEFYAKWDTLFSTNVIDFSDCISSFKSESDGLSNLAYKLISSDLNDLYTNITVNLKE